MRDQYDRFYVSVSSPKAKAPLPSRAAKAPPTMIRSLPSRPLHKTKQTACI